MAYVLVGTGILDIALVVLFLGPRLSDRPNGRIVVAAVTVTGVVCIAVGVAFYFGLISLSSTPAPP